MKKIIIKRKGKLVGEYPYSQELVEALEDKKYEHLCWDCQNASVNGCQKIKDMPKKKIGKYDFINDGYQIADSNNKLLVFSVETCDNYQKDEKPKRRTVAENQRLIEIKRDIIKTYFNTDSIQEARFKSKKALNKQRRGI